MPSYPVQPRTETTDTLDKEHRLAMKILLTGATGFLGSAILDDLVDRGDDVTVLLRNESRREALTRPDAPFAIGDLSEPDSFDIPLSDFDVVIHSAGLVSDWMDRATLMKVNRDGTLALAKVALRDGVKHFVHMSSAGVYGSRSYRQHKEDDGMQRGLCPYDESKYEAEVALWAFREQHGEFPLTVLRPGFVYGPQDRKFLPRTIQRIRDGQAKFVGGGDNALTTVYVENVTDMVRRVLANRDKTIGEAYNVVDGQGTTTRDLFDAIADFYGYPRVTKSVPYPVASGLASVLEAIYTVLRKKNPPMITRKIVTFMSCHRDLSIEKAKRELGYEPKAFDESIVKTLEALKAKGVQ